MTTVLKTITKVQSSPEFDVQYKRLNKRQKEAVDTIEGPVMVIAGPGTGKTTILTLRIANILRLTDTPPSGILAITYTDAGVKAMRTKLQGIIGNRAHEVPIHTFHSFASAMIAEYPDHFVAISEMKVMTEIEQESLIRSIVSDPDLSDLRPAGRPDAYLSGIIRAIENSKREAVTSSMVREFAIKEMERIQNDPASISSRGATKGKLKADAEEDIAKCRKTLLFADVYDRYETLKRTAKKLDFNDLIIELLLALRTDELLLRLIQERFLHILVDEHQDTNDAQNFIIGLIAEFFETPNVFIVGDEKQAIYRFQGASVENFLLLQKRWPTMKLISLDTNYRSHQGILDAGWNLIENNYEGDEHRDLRIPLISGTHGIKRQAIDVVTGENTAAMEDYFVKALQRLSREEPGASVAVIVRRNRELDRVISLLENNGIQVSSERSVNIFNHPIGARFFDLIEYLADISRADALARTIMAGMWGLSIEASMELVKFIKSGHDTGLERRLPGLATIRSRLLGDGPVSFLIEVAHLSGFTNLVSRDPAYVHVWQGIEALAESLVRDSDIKDPMELLNRMLAYRQSAESRTVKVSVGAPDALIRAMTAHGSKGLEFDYVFIPYATEDAWIGRNRGDSFVLPKKQSAGSDIRDTRRLFYVALTRARTHATVLTALEESDGKLLSPLRFIAELGDADVSLKVIPRLEKSLSKSAADIGSGGSQNNSVYKAFVDATKRCLSESGLSVTALNHFLECPHKFLYVSVLKLPQAPSVAAEKGSAMHLAFSRIWNAADKSVQNISTIITDSIEEYLKDSFLSVSEKNLVKKTLLVDAPVVATTLETHFAQKGTVSTERWARTEFEYDSMRLPIHGKLDVILDDGSEVRVYDYKTRQAMSAAAIKGETKDSDGNYFRQLVFYSLLLRGDPFWKGKRVVPALVFVSPDKKGQCPVVTLPILESDIDTVRADIKSLAEKTWSGEIYRSRCSDQKCEYCAQSASVLRLI